MDKQEINAGYAIKERFVVGNVGIALGHSETAVAPYVTWNYRKEAPKHFFWGHYFSSEREASTRRYSILRKRRENHSRFRGFA